MGVVDDMDNHKVSFPPFILCLKCPPHSENIVVNNSEFSHNFFIFKSDFLKKRLSNFIWMKFPFKLIRGPHSRSALVPPINIRKVRHKDLNPPPPPLSCQNGPHIIGSRIG